MRWNVRALVLLFATVLLAAQGTRPITKQDGIQLVWNEHVVLATRDATYDGVSIIAILNHPMPVIPDEDQSFGFRVRYTDWAGNILDGVVTNTPMCIRTPNPSDAYSIITAWVPTHEAAREVELLRNGELVWRHSFPPPPADSGPFITRVRSNIFRVEDPVIYHLKVSSDGGQTWTLLSRQREHPWTFKVDTVPKRESTLEVVFVKAYAEGPVLRRYTLSIPWGPINDLEKDQTASAPPPE